MFGGSLANETAEDQGSSPNGRLLGLDSVERDIEIGMKRSFRNNDFMPKSARFLSLDRPPATQSLLQQTANLRYAWPQIIVSSEPS
jgi:hypothetical protein